MFRLSLAAATGARLAAAVGGGTGPLQLACFGSFLEVGKCTVADETDYVPPGSSSLRRSEVVETGAAASGAPAPAPGVGAPMGAVAAPGAAAAPDQRRIAEVVLHPCAWDCDAAAHCAASERAGESRFHLVSVPASGESFQNNITPLY